ncbi:MAG: flagellar biosynthesis anti-sigma factor FlgM [Pelagibacterales bacterium]|mgnify:CR=1 FL=1|nr:flagellar biosynthesis anti-sigma factor FlgM [Pelagibacterales bacterium]OUU61831.1 MAG: flagellar biosynthesis anti-sigma factor FlgM [Alphaproteobacteria bacterium TMED62]|tara:strand:- start:7716 stop:8015 length:300 start_codon:yes stop_codon:yes gene_type:complete
MIDKLNNINAGNAQNKRAVEDSKTKDISIKSAKISNNNSEKISNNVDISSGLNIKDMSNQAPIDAAKISNIKEAIAKGDYPIDLDKIADALLQAYSDIK